MILFLMHKAGKTEFVIYIVLYFQDTTEKHDNKSEKYDSSGLQIKTSIFYDLTSLFLSSIALNTTVALHYNEQIMFLNCGPDCKKAIFATSFSPWSS
jgi:hypothetical protein